MIKPLTSLRFIFALMVFFSHLNYLVKFESEKFNSIYYSIFQEGYIGVSFFFILSGFILAYNYQNRILNDKISIKKFYTARLARIYPLHILTFIISLPLTYHIFLSDTRLWIIRAVTNLSLTQSFIPNKDIFFSFNAPSWSISDELFFYICFPFLIILIPKISNIKLYIGLLIILIVPMLTLFIPESHHSYAFYISPYMRIVDFMIGIYIYNVYKNVDVESLSKKFNLMEISAVLTFFLFFMFHENIPNVARYSYYYWIPMSYLIFTFAFQKGLISNFLSKRIFIHLGEISFGFYMFHQLVLRYFFTLNGKFFNVENIIHIVLLTFFITLVLSHYSYKWFEIPMNRYIRKVTTEQSKSE